MSTLFAVALTSTSVVVVGLVLALRALRTRAHAEALDRCLFEEFDKALAEGTTRARTPHGVERAPARCTFAPAKVEETIK